MKTDPRFNQDAMAASDHAYDLETLDRGASENRNSYHLGVLIAQHLLVGGGSESNHSRAPLTRVTIGCPRCSTQLRLPAKRSGRVRCPSCGASFEANTRSP